jgi:hypothetical protein
LAADRDEHLLVSEVVHGARCPRAQQHAPDAALGGAAARRGQPDHLRPVDIEPRRVRCRRRSRLRGDRLHWPAVFTTPALRPVAHDRIAPIPAPARGHVRERRLRPGAPGEYPVGSFTFVRAPQAFGGPFYLVHPPGRLPPGELLADRTPAASCTPRACSTRSEQWTSPVTARIDAIFASTQG